VDTFGGCFSTALHQAAERGHAGVAALLIERGANVNAQSDFGRTPLHEAAQNDQVAVARLLLDRGADVTRPTIAASRRSTGPVPPVKPALPNCSCRAALTPMPATPRTRPRSSLAQRHERPEVAALLRAHNATT
jgi:ankyrin repeat protein